jgi:hypothetical protein
MMILFMMVSSIAANAANPVFHLGQHQFEFHEALPGVLVSDHCLKKACDALKSVERYRSASKKMNSDLGGKNPFAWRCVHQAGGKVALLGDQKGNQVSVCIFDDDSMVNTKAFD